MKNYKANKTRMSKKNFYLAVSFIILSTILIIAVSIKRSFYPSAKSVNRINPPKAVVTENVKNDVKKNSTITDIGKPGEIKPKLAEGEKKAKEPEKSLATGAIREDVKKNEVKKEETKPKKASMIKPVEGDLLQKFSKDKLVFHEKTGVFKTRNGIEIQTQSKEPVKAAMDGTVISVEDEASWGKCIKIEHKDGLITVYKGLDADNLNVAIDSKVKAGDVIGAVSGSSKNSDLDAMPIFYFEVQKNGKYLDPLQFVKY